MNLYVKTKDNVKIFVEDINRNGKYTIFFIHGWPLNHNMWEYLVEYLIEFNYRCVTLDLRGYGNSDRPSTGYDYDTMAEDIKSVIDALQLNNITMVGYGMGGAISLRYVSKYNAHAVSNLCLLSAAAPSLVKTEEWKNGISVDKVTGLIQQNYQNRPDLITILKTLFFYRYTSNETLQWFSNLCFDASGWATGKSLLALEEERLFEDVKNINIPTLIIHGIFDMFCPFSFAGYLKENIKDSSLVQLSKAGHVTFIEDKDKTASSLDYFIRQHTDQNQTQNNPS